MTGYDFDKVVDRRNTASVKWDEFEPDALPLWVADMDFQAPPEVLDYVVVHELCHRNHMDHSPAFWAEVARVLPDYRKQKQWLKENGPGLIRRMTGA